MRAHRIASFLGCLTIAVGLLIASQAGAQQRDPQEDIWEEEPAPSQPPWQRWLDDQTIDRIMKGIQQRDPTKAKELTDLRKKNVDEFKQELIQQGGKEIEQITREQMEARRQKDQAEFADWLKANYPKDAEVLTKAKEKDPQVYLKSYDRLWLQYGSIFQARSSPELMALLKEDLELRKKRDDLVGKIQQEKAQDKKQALGAELRNVVFRRYDIIVRRKEIAYEQLQKKLEALQKRIQESQTQIRKWKDPGTKQKNVQQHVESLTEGKVTFKWD